MSRYDRAAQLRRNGGQHTQAQFVAKCAQFLNCCALCRTPNASLTRDHIVPVSMGGSDDISNIQPLCRTCNSSKGNRSAVAYKHPCELKRTRTDQRWTHGNVHVRIRQEKPDSAHDLHQGLKDYKALGEAADLTTGKARQRLRKYQRAAAHNLKRDHGLHVRKEPTPEPVVDPVAQARAMRLHTLRLELSALERTMSTRKGKERKRVGIQIGGLKTYIRSEYNVHV